MRKALRIIAIASGIVSAVSAAILGFMYLEDMLGYLKSLRSWGMEKYTAYRERIAQGEDYE